MLAWASGAASYAGVGEGNGVGVGDTFIESVQPEIDIIDSIIINISNSIFCLITKPTVSNYFCPVSY